MIRDRALVFADLVYVVKKYPRRIFFIAVLFSCAALLYFSTVRPPQYAAYCSFQEVGKQIETGSGLFSALRLVQFAVEDKGALVSMQSETLLGEAIQASGLQIWPRKGITLDLSNARSHFFKQADTLEFCSVRGDVDHPIHFFLRFTGPETFELLNERKALLSTGELGSAVQVGGVEITVAQRGKKKRYALTFLPLHTAIGKVKKSFSIRPNRQNPNLLQLNFSHCRRQATLIFLNELMEGYRAQLKRDHEQLVHKQLAYLKTREIEVKADYEKALAEHVAYLQEHLGETGFLHLSQELMTMEKPQLELSSRQSALAVDLEKWAVLKPYSHLLEDNKGQEIAMLEKEHAIKASRGSFCETSEFLEGVDLLAVQRLQEQSVQKQAEYRAEMDRLSGLRKRLLDPGFEVSALTDFFADPVGKSLAGKGSEIQIELLDRSNHSQKELERLESALKKQRELMLDHIDQRSLFLKEQWKEEGKLLGHFQARAMQLIKEEQNLTKAQLKEIGGTMERLPEKWQMETQIKLKRDFALQTLEGLRHLTESKLMEHQFFSVDSRAVDLPYAPPFPSTIDTKLIFIASGLFGGILSLGVLLACAPLPVSRQFFEMQKYAWAWHRQSGFLQTLAYHIPTHHAVTLFAGREKKQDGEKVALLFGQRGFKVLLVDIGQIEEGALREENAFWRACLQSSEALNGPSFSAKLWEWKEHFDVILLTTPWSFSQCLHAPLKNHCDALILYIQNETAGDIASFAQERRTFFVLEGAQ